MLGIGTGELLLILVIAVLVVGPERMVEFAGQAGRWLAKVRALTEDVTQEFHEAISLEAPEDEQAAAASGGGGAQAAVEASGEGETAPPALPEPTALAATPQPSALLDGEQVPFIPIGADGDTSTDADAEPVTIEVAQLVPEDEDVEPIVASDLVVITDEAVSHAATESEG